MELTHSNWSEAQRQRMARFGVAACVDLHCHCLPGLDDGPAGLEAALSLCRALAEDGFTTVVATPHQLGRYDRRNDSAAVRAAVADLNAQLVAAGVPLSVVPGGDIRIDERLMRLLREDRVTTIGDRGGAILLELPHELYVDPRWILKQLAGAKILAVITHPERYAYLQRRPELVEAMMEQGGVLQVTAGSLTGDFGTAAHAASWAWLRRGWVSVVATDAHNAERRPPRMSAAMEAIEREMDAETARRVCIGNPIAVLEGRFAAAAGLDAPRVPTDEEQESC